MKRHGKGWLFLGALLLLIPALLFMYLARPAMAEAKRVEQLLEQRRAGFGEKVDEVVRAGDDRPLVAYKLASVRADIPEKPYPDRILRDVELLQSASGITVQTIQIDMDGTGGAADELRQLQGGTGTWFMPVRINLTLEGTYGQIDRLMEELESMNRLYHVDQMTVTAGEQKPVVTVNDEHGLLNCQISFLTYYAPTLIEHGDDSGQFDYLPAEERLHPFS